jgi:hypothetical protein
MRSMNKYERLLIELGEKNYQSNNTSEGSFNNWSPEVRIIFIALINAVTFIIIKMLASYIGEDMATTIIDGLSSYFSGTPPQPGQVLFGTKSPTTSSRLPNLAPVPEARGGPFGGIDIASLIGNLGSAFLKGQAQNPIQQNTTAPVAPQTPRYKPVYEE